jgi:hypothetical protein
MALHTELKMLLEEERVLIRASSKLNAQLNRLKVEELALQSQIRLSQPNSVIDQTDNSQVGFQNPEEVNKKILCLDVKKESANEFEIVEEEDEDEDDEDIAPCGDQLSSFLQHMEHKILTS